MVNRRIEGEKKQKTRKRLMAQKVSILSASKGLNGITYVQQGGK